jgi:hypothetical protein
MVANIRGFTPTYGFKLINFDTPRWHTLEYANWSQLDAMFLQVGVPGMRGEWQNGTSYLAGERVFDVQTADLYRCLVAHVSPTTGTFEAARTANPGFWVLQTLGVPLFRGDWSGGVQYSLGDLVKVDDYKYYLCVVRHISSATFAPDVLFWTFVFDATATINDANAAATSAGASAVAADVSADAALVSETNAKTSETLAKTSETNAKTSETAAKTSETNAKTSEDNALASAQTAGLQATSLRGTSLTTNTISAGSKTFTTQPSKQFNVGNYMTIVATSNPNGQVMTGSITAYDNVTTGNVTVNVTGTLGSGSVSNWQLYISGMQGQKGADGSGGGGIPDANADGTLYGRVNNTWQAAIKRNGDTMTGHLSLLTGPAADNAVRKDYVDSAISAINLSPYALIASPAFTGNPTAPTPTAGDNDTSVATTAFVTGAVATGVASVPTTPAASVAEYITGTINTKMVTPKTAWDAAATTFSLGTGATVTPSMSSGIDFTWNPSAVSVTLGNPTNTKVGQKGVIYIITQTANTAITWGSNFKFAGGNKPSLSTAAGSIDVLSYVCRSATSIMCTFSVDMK